MKNLVELMWWAALVEPYSYLRKVGLMLVEQVLKIRVNFEKDRGS
jgi:hypothetical protein